MGNINLTDLCDYYSKMDGYCSVGQGRCDHDGDYSVCKMINQYKRQVLGIKSKTYEEEYKVKDD
jgi:hypothetical protein